MSEPLFSVDEKVWLESGTGKYTGVTDVEAIRYADLLDCKVCGNHGHYVYRLGILGPRGYEWVECVIRKIPPSEEEFDSFINKLELGFDLSDIWTPQELVELEVIE